MLETTVCPDPQCQAPAEVLDRFELWSTSGPYEHISTRCVLGHIFTVPIDRTYADMPYPISASIGGLFPPV
jgi:hypothetical protein